MSEWPGEAVATLRDFTRCLNPEAAIVDRPALEEVLSFLAAIRTTYEEERSEP